MEKAILKAQEGGYKFSFFEGEAIQKFSNGTFVPAMFYKELLDPLFWQCLGKAEGWDANIGHDLDLVRNWHYYWHSFIDHLAKGKNPDDFFNNLLTPKQG